MAFKPGTSGNPSGRPRGIADKRNRLRRELEKSGSEIIKAVIAAAKNGDLQACRLVLERICPPLRPVDSPQSVDVGAGSLADLGENIVRASLRGDLPPDWARELTSALSALARLKEATEFEQRLAAIESRLKPQS